MGTTWPVSYCRLLNIASNKRLLWKAQTRTAETWELTVYALSYLGPPPATLSALACWPLGLPWRERAEHKTESVLWHWGPKLRVLCMPGEGSTLKLHP